MDIELTPGCPPLVRAPRTDGAEAFAAAHRDELLAAVAEHGAVLVRGLDLRDAAELGRVAKHMATELMEAREGFAPRSRRAEHVYSAPEWPADQPLCAQHELSYAARVPRLLVQGCLVAPNGGGSTGLADGHAVLDRLPADVVERFERLGWTLRRSYRDLIGVSIADAFGGDDAASVADHCKRNDVGHTWDPDALRTVQHRNAVLTHPATGRRCWFNQIAFLSEWSLAPEVREYLLDEFGPDGLPYTTTDGAGEPVDEDVVACINAVYEEVTVREPWCRGDLLLVDNLRMALSSEPAAGERDLVVAFADPFDQPLPRPGEETTRADRR